MALGKKITTGGPVDLPVSEDGLTIPVSGTLTATIDESTLATSAKQDTGNTSLTSIDGKVPAKGTAAMAGSTPVTLATNDTLGLTLATGAKQDTGNTSLGTLVTRTPALGSAASASSSPVVIASDQGAVPVSAASLPLPTGAATSAAQTSAQTSLTTIAASAAGSKTAGQATMANSVPVAIASDQSAIPAVVVTSTDIGQNLALSSAAAFTFSSAACKVGIMLCAPIANTLPVYVALGNTLTTSTGIELQPGDREFIPLGVGNATQISARCTFAGSVTQNIRALAV